MFSDLVEHIRILTYPNLSLTQRITEADGLKFCRYFKMLYWTERKFVLLMVQVGQNHYKSKMVNRPTSFIEPCQYVAKNVTLMFLSITGHCTSNGLTFNVKVVVNLGGHQLRLTNFIDYIAPHDCAASPSDFKALLYLPNINFVRFMLKVNQQNSQILQERFHLLTTIDLCIWNVCLHKFINVAVQI